MEQGQNRLKIQRGGAGMASLRQTARRRPLVTPRLRQDLRPPPPPKPRSAMRLDDGVEAPPPFAHFAAAPKPKPKPTPAAPKPPRGPPPGGGEEICTLVSRTKIEAGAPLHGDVRRVVTGPLPNLMETE